jgi:tetratricopeptide (TPR) repeat protein
MGHGVRDYKGDRLGEEQATIAATLSRLGYRCAAFVSAAVLDHRTGIAQGFSEYDDGSFQKFRDKDRKIAERAGDETLQLASEWLLRNQGFPFFLWVHLYEPHYPYTPPEPMRSRYTGDLYSGEVARADSVLQTFFEFLKKNGIYQPSLITLLSDHGEGLGDHRESQHGFFVYQSTMHVPWILKLPGNELSGRTIRQNTSLVDVFPTLLQILQVARSRWPASIQGRSRYGAIRAAGGASENSEPFYMESVIPRNDFGWSDLRAIQQGRFKMIEAPLPELYDLDADPSEGVSLFDNNRSVVLQMRESLKRLEAKFNRNIQQTSDADPELQQRLRSLGYVGLASGIKTQSREGLADPKSKIETYERVVRATRTQNPSIVIRELQALAAAEPQSPLLLTSLALAYRDTRQPEKAVEWFSRVIQRWPDDLFARIQLAQDLLLLGREAEAEKQYQVILARNPRNFQALSNLGTMYGRRSRFAEAIDYFTRALSVHEDGAGLRSLALAQMRSGQWAAAEKHLLRALQLDSNDRKAHQQLAELYEETGNKKKADHHARLAREP